jgi:predicted enzyme related to lactoylglutathione lyase
MLERTEYPAGVPCWIDIVQPDFDRALQFYGGLFDWKFQIRTPEGAPVRYAYALVDGLTVAGIGSSAEGDAQPAGWTQYVRVDSADETAAVVVSQRGNVLSAPVDIPRSGRVALCADASGATIGLWQPGDNRGVQVVNAPSSWNFSELHTSDPDGAKAFYGAVFGWQCEGFELGPDQTAWLFRMPGYGAFLADRDPELRERHEANRAPDGFADAVAWLEPCSGSDPTPASWSVTFAVADADAAFARAIGLGATAVTAPFDTPYTRQSTVRDPQGASFTLSEYRPPQPD